MTTVSGTTSSRGGLSREFCVTVGSRYRVEPLNPAKLKHRGRAGVVESLAGEPFLNEATIRFDDNGRCGRVDVSDLVPCDG